MVTGGAWRLKSSARYTFLSLVLSCTPRQGISLECEEGETEHEAGMERRGVATG